MTMMTIMLCTVYDANKDDKNDNDNNRHADPATGVAEMILILTLILLPLMVQLIKC